MPLRPAAISLTLIYLVGLEVLVWAPETVTNLYRNEHEKKPGQRPSQCWKNRHR